MGDILDHHTLGRSQPIVAYTLLVPANIRVTTRRYGEVSRTQITLCHATVRQLRYPGKISLPILIKFAFSLWCQSFFTAGSAIAYPETVGNGAQNHPENSGDYPIRIHHPILDTRSARVFTDRLWKTLRPTFQQSNLGAVG